MSEENTEQPGIMTLHHADEPQSRQKNVGLELTHKLNQARASYEDWEKDPSYSLTSFTVNGGPNEGVWRVFGQVTKDAVAPPRARIVVAQHNGEDWFNAQSRHVTIERLDDGQRLISDPQLLSSFGPEVNGVLNAVGASASFMLNRGFTVGKSLSHVKTRRLGEDVGFAVKVTEARIPRDEPPSR